MKKGKIINQRFLISLGSKVTNHGVTPNIIGRSHITYQLKENFSGIKKICIDKLKYVWIESYSVIKSTQFNKKGENVYFLFSSGSKGMSCTG